MSQFKSLDEAREYELFNLKEDQISESGRLIQSMKEMGSYDTSICRVERKLHDTLIREINVDFGVEDAILLFDWNTMRLTSRQTSRNPLSLLRKIEWKKIGEDFLGL